MKVLVTGATSGLGRNAAQWLLEAGHEVYAIGRDQLAGEELRKLGATFIPLDLTMTTMEVCQQWLKTCDVVWHCAAKSAPWGNPQDFHQTNVVVTHKLAQAAGREGVKRFIHISSPAVYFDFRHHHDLPETYRASRFSSHYASSKYAAEQVLHECIAHYPDTTYVILRPRGLFGPHDRVIVPRLLQQLSRDRNVLRLPGGGQAQLDLTFVLNVVHAMMLATDNDGLRSGAIYNITNQEPQRLVTMLDSLLNQQLHINYTLQPVPYSLLSVVAAGMELVASMTQKEPLLTRYSVGAVYFDMTLNSERAVNELGYRPRYSMAEGIVLAGEWLSAQRSGQHG
ncbi:3-beta hydroxysteroid dehydrogenase/isomerase family protein [Yersinia pseudotuberculosis IP 32953]|uniref:NAD(P)-dependent oxidoreductase n=9 Tax=Yersinia pseudotuberculosis complex TaxID=1649845 RepID=A0ABM7ALQ8_YERPU|nr:MULTISPECIES: NAD(P)-dependent oxidoreductase [Yersinia pseudotuberculosis complex]CQD48700.1 putative dehydrogenase [Yersinia intermedia]ABS47581.1 NAD-dependent epimerase/dehydratase family protein [Yersinia pseudotuberculosis IP 31758]AIN13678.1 3-beta hydroxysteroid dehydrogenase/isomerase family protein [Yersinia pseudotuberculosis]AJJ03342.1 3-beta hydroxysteroid dehydrogenase/isomerase family protein [Yersinia pseudotuberculosis]AJJ07641.1 3-beta hydroxysteroid dehydrogenase/isomeras